MATIADPTADQEFAMLQQASPADFEVLMRLGKRDVAASAAQQFDGVNGVVYRVRHRITGREYALKFMLNFYDVSYSKFREHFEQEYRIPESVLPPHPSVVRVYRHLVATLSDFNIRDLDADFVFQTTMFIIMELGECTLKSYLRDNQPLSVLEICDILASLISGVRHLQQHQVAHCDLKQDNVVRTKDARWVLIDFGSGKDFRALHRLPKMNDLPPFVFPYIPVCSYIYLSFLLFI